jgi:hypothetical protein
MSRSTSRLAALVDVTDHRCRGGWLDRDADQPRPCLVCRPHLADPYRARPATEAERADQLARIRRGVMRCRAALDRAGARTERPEINGDGRTCTGRRG